MSDKPKFNKVKFEYVKPNDLKPIYVNGVIGGPTAKGEIIVNFFTEAAPVPNAQVYEILDTGKIGIELLDKRLPTIGADDTFTMLRHVQATVMMNIAEARIFHKWLGEQIATIESKFVKK